jgi:hypothetical protein
LPAVDLGALSSALAVGLEPWLANT